MPCLSDAVAHAHSNKTAYLGVGWTLGLAPYTPLSSNGTSRSTQIAFPSCYSSPCLVTANGTNPIARHVGTALLHSSHGSRPCSAREGCVADDIALFVQCSLDGGPSRSGQ
jgi:hypothetical protein